MWFVRVHPKNGWQCIILFVLMFSVQIRYACTPIRVFVRLVHPPISPVRPRRPEVYGVFFVGFRHGALPPLPAVDFREPCIQSLIIRRASTSMSPAYSRKPIQLITQGGAEWEVAPNLSLGDDYVMLPKPLWNVMCDWYGGGPVFSRQVVKVSSNLQLPEKARRGVDENGAGSTADR